jgi:hypothetical protein
MLLKSVVPIISLCIEQLIIIKAAYHAKRKQEANTKNDSITPSLPQGRSRRSDRRTTTSHDVLMSRA